MEPIEHLLDLARSFLDRQPVLALATLRLPLPSSGMVCNDLVVNLNGASVLGQLQINSGARFC
jgi:hypothetical protein